MASIEVHAGDFLPGKQGKVLKNGLKLATKRGIFGYKFDIISYVAFETVEVASEESVKRLWGAAGLGAAGAILLGPLGLLAGVLAGGRGKNVTFAAKLKDGRRLLATTDGKTFIRIQSAVF